MHRLFAVLSAITLLGGTLAVSAAEWQEGVLVAAYSMNAKTAAAVGKVLQKTECKPSRDQPIAHLDHEEAAMEACVDDFLHRFRN